MPAKQLPPPEFTKTPYAHESKKEALFAAFGLVLLGCAMSFMGIMMHFLPGYMPGLLGFK